MTTRLFAFILKALLITTGCLAFVVIAGFYSLPALLTSQLPGLIERHTGRKASLAAATLQLSPLALGLQGFVLREKDQKTLLAFDELSVEIDARQSWQQTALVIRQLTLKKPEVYLSRNQDGRFNFQDLAPDSPQTQTDSGAGFSVDIAKFAISGGQLVWNHTQATKPWSETLHSLDIVIENVNSRSNIPAHISLNMALQSGGHLAWDGTLALSPLTSLGHLKLDNVNLPKFTALFLADSGVANMGANNTLEADYQLAYSQGKLIMTAPKASFELHDIEYAQAGQTLKLAGLKHETSLSVAYAPGEWRLEAQTAHTQANTLRIQDSLNQLLGELKQLTAATAYQVTYNDHHLNMSASQAAMTIKELRISGQGGELISLPALAVQGIQANLDQHTLKISSLTLDNADLSAWLDTDGRLNYQALLPTSTPSPAKVSATPAVDWDINVGNIALNNCAVNFEDRTLPKPTTLTLKPINLKLSGYANNPSTPLPFTLSAGINDNGLISLQGNLVLAPLAMETAVTVNTIDLEKFQPYYDRFIRLDIIDGMLDIDGTVSLKQTENQPLDIRFNGNGGIDDLLIRDQRVHKDFLKWERLALKNMVIDVLGQRYSATELTLNKPYARVTIRKDKTVNFSDLLIAQEQPAGTASAPKTSATKPAFFKLGKIQIIDGSSDFTDLSLLLPFSAHIKSLDGGASGVSSDKSSHIQVDLKGNAYDLAPVDIAGNISPFLDEYDIKINFNGLPMPLVSSYMVQFAGYKVEKGKMTLDLHYQIANKKLTASNHFLIDQFELGERVENPDAVSLPLKLAVALLKDSDGKIKMDVPISGDLDKPHFNIGAIVTEALINALSKVISSPFSALASLTGGQHSDLSAIAFKAGSAALENAQQEKLNGIAAALKVHTQLMLEIKGVTQQQQDWPAISDDALYDQLKIRRAAEINGKTARKIRAEYVELSTQDYQRLLADMFIEKFPALAKKSWLGTPQLNDPGSGNFYNVAKQKLQDIINPEQERLKELANDRSQAIAKYLVQQGGIAQERVYILDSVVDTDKNNKEIASLLALKAN
ncbi:MAG: DUF748 domain-containing protein [Methylovulum sp.]|nr:DUF748 domain-containing protein [Methylovulum sp.]